jgi:hypothetical protein
MFSRTLEELGTRRVYNRDLFEYTIRQVAMQSYHLLVERTQNAALQGSPTQEEFQKIGALLNTVGERTSAVIIINTGGGASVVGNVTIGGNFIGRDLLQTACCGEGV